MSPVAMPRRPRRSAPSPRSESAPRPALLVLLAIVACLAIPASTAWAQDATLGVTSTGDEDVADEKLSVREAIKLINGELGRPLTDAESLLLSGDPGPGKHNRLQFNVTDVDISAQLPVIKQDDTSVEGLPTTLSGGGVVTRGLGFRADRLSVEEMTLADFTGFGVTVDSSPELPSVRDFNFDHVVVRDGGGGIRLHATGEGHATLNLLNSSFLQLAKLGIDLLTLLEGDYNFAHGVARDLSGALDTKVVAQAETGPINLNWIDMQDIRSVPGGSGSLFTIGPGSFETNFTASNGIWRDLQGNALTIDVSAKANLNLRDITVTGEAKAAVHAIVRPLPDVETRFDLSSLISQGPETGLKTTVNGRLIARWEFLQLFDGLFGVDLHAGPEVTGSLTGRDWRVTGRAGIGVRMKGTRLFDFDFTHGFFHDHRNGFQFVDFPDSVSVDDATVTGNSGLGFALNNTHARITNSIVSGNQGGGIVASAKSVADLSGLTVENNGGDGIALKGSDGTIAASRIRANTGNGVLANGDVSIVGNEICFNALDGIRVGRGGEVGAISNLIDQNGGFELANRSRSHVAANGNDWGVLTTNEMESNPFPSNITEIFDSFDSRLSGFVDYNGWVSPPSTTCGGT
jgi:Right handed beta helix region